MLTFFAVWAALGVLALLHPFTRPCGIAWLLFWPSLVLPPVLVPLVLPFTKWRQEPFGAEPTGTLPTWASWLQTPDQRLPGDMKIDAVRDLYLSRGRFICSWYWLGFRNPAQGLAAAFGRPVAMPWSPLPGFYRDGSLWWLRKPILGGRRQLKAGWRTYPDGNGGWTAVPCLTVTKP